MRTDSVMVYTGTYVSWDGHAGAVGKPVSDGHYGHAIWTAGMSESKTTRSEPNGTVMLALTSITSTAIVVA